MEHDGCVGCRYEHLPSTNSYCQGCKQNAIDKYIKLTNADKIKNMTNEELAGFLCTLIYNCRNKKDIKKLIHKKPLSLKKYSQVKVKEWLESTYKNI